MLILSLLDLRQNQNPEASLICIAVCSFAAENSIICSPLCGLLVELWWCFSYFQSWEPAKCTVGIVWRSCEDPPDTKYTPHSTKHKTQKTHQNTKTQKITKTQKHTHTHTHTHTKTHTHNKTQQEHTTQPFPSCAFHFSPLSHSSTVHPM